MKRIVLALLAALAMPLAAHGQPTNAGNSKPELPTIPLVGPLRPTGQPAPSLGAGAGLSTAAPVPGCINCLPPLLGPASPELGIPRLHCRRPMLPCCNPLDPMEAPFQATCWTPWPYPFPTPAAPK